VRLPAGAVAGRELISSRGWLRWGEVAINILQHQVVDGIVGFEKNLANVG
jgi:hypothetical protein